MPLLTPCSMGAADAAALRARPEEPHALPQPVGDGLHLRRGTHMIPPRNECNPRCCTASAMRRTQYATSAAREWSAASTTCTQENSATSHTLFNGFSPPCGPAGATRRTPCATSAAGRWPAPSTRCTHDTPPQLSAPLIPAFQPRSTNPSPTPNPPGNGLRFH